jgi:hypothetical protein
MIKNRSEQARDPLAKMVHYLCHTYAFGLEDGANYVAQNYLTNPKLKEALDGIFKLFSSEDMEERGKAHDEFEKLLRDTQEELDKNS